MGLKCALERVTLRILAQLAVLLIMLAALAAFAQVPGGSQGRTSVGPRQRNAKVVASDTSLFLPAATYDSGGGVATSVAVLDVNGDRKPDIVVANWCANASNCYPYVWGADGSVAVLLGKGDGSFLPAVAFSSGGASPKSVALADVNGDGKPDIIVENWCASSSNCSNGSVGVLLGNGDGTFQTPVTYSSGGGFAGSVAVADVNRDGAPDIVVANWCQTNLCYVGTPAVAVLLGNGDGTFQAAVDYVPGGDGANWIAVADVNGDGNLDLLVTTYVVGVMLGKGDGTFFPGVTYDTGAWGATSVAVADVNGDDKPDLVVSHGIVNGVGQPVGVLLGNGDGTYQAAVTYDSGGGSVSVAVADLNLDGKPDLFVAIADSSTVGVMLGNGNGTFQPVLAYGSGGFTMEVIAADLNGDGRPDLVVANQNWGYADGSVSVLLNNTPFYSKTTTTLSSSSNSSQFGQTVTFTATIASPAGTPTGSVQILNGTTVIGSGTLTSGSVSIPVSTLPAGTDSIIASYLGGGGFAPSKSSPLTQTVTLAATTTTLASSLNPAGTNQPVSFSATVTGRYGGAVTGMVTFYSGAQTLSSNPVSGGVAILTTSFASAGTYSISAQYGGDTNNIGSSSATLSERVIPSTTTMLVSSLNPSLVGQAVTFTATVSSSAGAPPNGEIVTFKNGSAVLGTAPLNTGKAQFTTSSLSAGGFTITANYLGDSNFAASTSPGLRQVVNSLTKSATTTTFVSSLNPSIYGQKITWTATVTTTGPVPPTGSVSFNWSDGFRTFNIGTATLNSSGVAILTRSNLNADPYPLTAKYQGDNNNLASTSPILNQTVLQATSAATITSSPNPSSVGQAVTFTAQIASPTVTPTGPVTFKAGTTVLETVQLSGGKASYTTTSLPAGSAVVKVTYNGDSNIKGSSAVVTQVVQP